MRRWLVLLALGGAWPLIGQSPSSAAPPWILTPGSAPLLALPERLRDRVAEELEYDSLDTIHGVALDLNHDRQPDFIIQSAPSLCGNGGCQYLVIDGASYATIGTMSGVAIQILPIRDHDFLRLAIYTHQGIGNANYTLFSFGDAGYQPSVQHTLTGAAQDSLVAAWRALPGW